MSSPSSRRAWIEICCAGTRRECQAVALLAEGVDRNSFATLTTPEHSVALLAEGVDRNHNILAVAIRNAAVALLAEGVDRNVVFAVTFFSGVQGRPPRGGRG